MKLKLIISSIICSVIFGVGAYVYAGYPYTMTYSPSTSDTILADHINTSNNEHINNNIPESIDDYSNTVGEMQGTTDPYPASSESQATTLDGELQRLRYVILQLQKIFNTAETNWYGDAGAIRAVTLRLDPGATPGTNIDVDELAQGFNRPTVTDATDLAKSGTSGSFSLDAAGEVLTMDITENINGVLCTSIVIHDLNTSSTSEMYTAKATVTSNNITLSLIKRGSTALVDLTTILDAGDLCDIQISFITST